MDEFGFCSRTQAEELPAVAQTAPESDSDSGMGSPAEEIAVEAVNNKEGLPGEVTQQWMLIQPGRGRTTHLFCVN